MEKFQISIYLRDYDQASRRGTCRACSKTVKWARDCVAAHKRASCENVSAEEKYKFPKISNASSLNESVGTSLQVHSRGVNHRQQHELMQHETSAGETSIQQFDRNLSEDSTIDEANEGKFIASDELPAQPQFSSHLKDNCYIPKTDEFQISIYLRDYDQTSRRGTCKACLKTVKWSRSSVGSHKRASCENVSAEEKRKFAKISNASSLNESVGTSLQVHSRGVNHTRRQQPEFPYRRFDQSPSEDSTNSEVNERKSFASDELPVQPQFYSHSKDNCYICDALLGSFKKDLSTIASFTETPLYEIIGNFVGIELSTAQLDESGMCHKCFKSLEKYDDLVYQSQEIQNNLAVLFHKTHSEKVYIKEEPAFEDEAIRECKNLVSENCTSQIFYESRDNVKNEEQTDEDSIDYNNGSPSSDANDEEYKMENSDKKKFDDDVKVKGAVECSQCKATFKSSKNYFRHLKTHAPKDDSLYCKTCSLNFKTTLGLHIHIATDHDRGNGPFDCPVCQKTFLHKKALRSHYYIHTNQNVEKEKTVLCWQCGAKLVPKSLESHMMTHADIRPFECTIPGCAKRFRTATKRNIHIRVHTREKIFECNLCPGRRFAQKWGLDLHVKKHHKGSAVTQKEVCKICGINVPSKSKMKIHMQNVHDVADNENI